MQNKDHFQESIYIHALKSASIQNGLDIGDQKITKIVKFFGSLSNLFKERPRQIIDTILSSYNIEFSLEDLQEGIDLEYSYKQLSRYTKEGVAFVNHLETDYPQDLLKLEKAPFLLYYFGDISNLKDKQNIAIVGTRRASKYGKHVTCSIVDGLKDYGQTIVSGFADGIDLESHMAAMRNQMQTAAVLGAGLHKAIPPHKRKTFTEMLNQQGNCAISEFIPDQDASKWTFASRNRIIAALSQATIVVEAPEKSGALITANFCTELKKPLYAIPGDLDKRNFKGCNKLIASEQAKSLASIDQLINDLELEANEPQIKNKVEPTKITNKIDTKIIEALSIPKSFDMLIRDLGLDQKDLASHLSILEIKGQIQKSNSRYQRS